MEKINNIRFGTCDGYVEFTYYQNDIKKTAQLQLPDVPDSIHTINNINSDEWYLKDDENGNCEEREIFEILSNFYFDSFEKDTGYAASSALCGTEIQHIEEITHKNTIVYVAYDNDESTYLLIDSAYKDYYNKAFLFENLDTNKQLQVFGSIINESKIIEKANNQRINK